MKQIWKFVAFSVASCGLMASISSCDNDVEPIEIHENSIEKQAPEVYAHYLETLRNYKNSPHKVVIGWFDNSETTPASQGQNLTALPDSVDFVVLKHPEKLSSLVQEEMKRIKENKATQTLFEINYAALQKVYDDRKQAFEEATENEGKAYPIAFNAFMVDTLQAQLSLFEQYAYDGVVISFVAKTKVYMTPHEQATQMQLENAYLGIAKDWKERHPNKVLILSGRPQNVADQSVLDLANYIIIPCYEATNAGDVVYAMNKAAVEGVPTSKLIPLVTLYSLDKTDTKTGYWGNNYAALGAAKFVATAHSGYDVAGLALDNMNNDYYHANFIYPVVRTAIAMINPTVKQ